MTDTETLVYGYGWNQATRDWTKRVEYVARDLREALGWAHFNRNWLIKLTLEEQHDLHVVERLERMLD